VSARNHSDGGVVVEVELPYDEDRTGRAGDGASTGSHRGG
jgi:hypothetical protein